MDGNFDYVLEIFNNEIDDMDFMIPEGFIESLEGLSEAESEIKYNQLKLEINDVEKFVKLNNCRAVTNPTFFTSVGVPSPDGLLSNDIFGITKDSREGIWAYIDLGEYFLDPSCYKNWVKIDSTIKNIVHRTNKYIIDENGYFVENEKGKNGVKFLKDNFDQIKFRKTDSIKRDIRIDYIKRNQKVMFLKKYLVIPAYYRDMNTSDGGGKANVGAINKLYASLISSVNSLTTTKDMGFDNTGAICGRIQETLVAIYDWFVGNANGLCSEEGTGISGKKGILKRANLSKTADFSSRLVLSAQELKVESVDNIMVDIEHAAIPLSAMIADFKPFILYNVKRFFDNEFSVLTKYPVINDKGKVEYLDLVDPMMEFSEERIEEEMSKFLHGYSNRFVPILAPVDSKKPYYITFKGRKDRNIPSTAEDIYNRRLTWVDIFYIAAVETARDKTVLMTRFPINRNLSAPMMTLDEKLV